MFDASLIILISPEKVVDDHIPPSSSADRECILYTLSVLHFMRATRSAKEDHMMIEMSRTSYIGPSHSNSV